MKIYPNGQIGDASVFYRCDFDRITGDKKKTAAIIKANKTIETYKESGGVNIMVRYISGETITVEDAYAMVEAFNNSK